MKVRYLGPHDEGSVAFKGGEYAVTRGEVAEVPDELGALLLENPEQYEPVKAGRPTKTGDGS